MRRKRCWHWHSAGHQLRRFGYRVYDVRGGERLCVPLFFMVSLSSRHRNVNAWGYDSGMMNRTRRIIAAIALMVILGGLALLWWAGSLPWPLYGRQPWGPRFPVGIVIHHTATPPVVHGRLVDASFLNATHKARGFVPAIAADGTRYYVGYHYVILQDGTIQHGRPEHSRGSHTKGHPNMLGIVLVGNFERASNRGRQGPLTPPPAQLAAAERLTRKLMRKYHLRIHDVYLHRDLSQTACPGDGFPRATFFRALGQ